MVEERRQLQDTVGSVAPQYDYGLPGESVRGLPYQLVDLFSPYRFPVEREAGIKQTGDMPAVTVDPETGRVITSYPAAVDPGQYGEGEFGLEYMPAVRGAKAGLEFFGDLFTDPETRQRAADVMRTAPAEIIRQEKLRADAASMGLEYIRDPRTKEVLSTAETVLLGPATTAGGTQAALRNVPRGTSEPDGMVLGITGGPRARSAKRLEAQFQELLSTGLSEEEAYKRMAQAPSNKRGFLSRFFQNQDDPPQFPVYRDDIEGDIRFVIDSDRELIFKGPQLTAKELDTMGFGPPNYNDPKYQEIENLTERIAAHERDVAAYRLADIPEERLEAMTGFFDNDGYLAIGGRDYLMSEDRKKLGVDADYRPTTTLEEVLDDEALFNEYPRLRSVRVKETPVFSFGLRGYYDPATRTIGLSRFKLNDEGMQELKSTLSHEIQHAIQHIEGQSGGANVSIFETPEYRQLKAAHDEQNKALTGEITALVSRTLSKKLEGVDEKTREKILKDADAYLGQKLRRRPDYDLIVNDKMTFDERVASGEDLRGSYRDKAELIESVGRDAVDELEANSSPFLSKAAVLAEYEQKIRAEDSKNFALYQANPGEVNARLTSLLNVGYRQGEVLRESDGLTDENLAKLDRAFPGRLEALRGFNDRLLHVKVLEPITGPELTRVFTPNELRPFVYGELKGVDESQLTDPRFVSPPARSQSPPSGSSDRLDFIRNRLAFLRGSLEQDTDMTRATRRRLENEARALSRELREFVPPEQKAQGGPAGGLGVYFRKMQMQGA